MSTKLGLRQKPEDAELNIKHQELQQLENQLIDRELHLAGEG